MWLDGRFCRSKAPIRAHILKEFGLSYSHSGCLKLLARLGFEYRKPKGPPRVAPAERQAAFIDRYERLLTELGAGEAVYFADAVHPEYQTKPAYGWVKAGSNPAVTTTAGRGRVNIHGALNSEGGISLSNFTLFALAAPCSSLEDRQIRSADLVPGECLPPIRSKHL